VKVSVTLMCQFFGGILKVKKKDISTNHKYISILLALANI
jgi:hypothetical protein